MIFPFGKLTSADLDDLSGELQNAVESVRARLRPFAKPVALARLECRGLLVSLRVAHPGCSGTVTVEFTAYPAGKPLLAHRRRLRKKGR